MKARAPVKTIAARLLAWYTANGRDLPWRETRDPYRILVSEVMLHQTQVSRVIPFYQAWTSKFPDWKTLAQAATAEIITMWSGLGYNRRALMLQTIARRIVETSLPQTEAEWREMKGIGAYTAAALTVFAQNQRAVPIDTNIRRVGARLLLGIPFPIPADDEALTPALATVISATDQFSDLVQALFDLAGQACTKKPNCPACPISRYCAAYPRFRDQTLAIPTRSRPVSRERRHHNKPHPDRIYRGRLLKLVAQTSQGVAKAAIGPAIDESFSRKEDETWLIAIINRLIRDGLIVTKGQRLFLP
jgi:A/G-specific adenine glycosylase